MKQPIFLFFMFLSGVIAAQNINWSQAYESKVTKDGFTPLAETGNSIIIKRRLVVKMYVHAGSTLLERINKKTKAVEASKKFDGEGDLVTVKVIKGKIILFSLVRKGEIKKAYAQRLKDDLTPDGESVLLNEATDRAINMGAVRNQLEFPLIDLSPDSSSFYCLQAGKNDGKRFLVCSQHTSELKEMNKNQYDLPYVDREMIMSLFKADNAGNCIAMVATCDKNNSMDAGRENDVLSFNIKSNQVKVKRVLEMGNDIEEITASCDSKGNIVIGGVMIKVEDKYRSESGFYKVTYSGYFFIWSKEGSEPVFNYREFDKTFTEKFAAENLYIRSLIVDGENAYLIFEQRDGIRSKAYKRFNYAVYNDIGIAKFNAKGQLWITSIPKRQDPKSGYRWEQAGFDVYLNKNRLHFIFNDDPANTDVNNNEPKICHFKEIVTMLVTVDPDGKKTKKVLIDYKDGSDMIYFPGMGLKNINFSRAMLYSGNKSSYKIGDIDWSK